MRWDDGFEKFYNEKSLRNILQLDSENKGSSSASSATAPIDECCPDDDRVLEILRSVYGSPSAPRSFYLHFCEIQRCECARLCRVTLEMLVSA